MFFFVFFHRLGPRLGELWRICCCFLASGSYHGRLMKFLVFLLSLPTVYMF